MRLWMRLTVCVFGIRWVRLNLVFFDTCGCAFRCDPCGMCVNSCRDFHKLIPVLCHLTFARHLSPAQVGDLKARIVELEGQLAKLSAANQKRDGHEVHTGVGCCRARGWAERHAGGFCSAGPDTADPTPDTCGRCSCV